ncbi:hypothetical protein [Photobacterium nomapromontoriensis]|uniref:hypothetical protein n=1 Tax=Photobacterium nomapromontoriensis TaxID=2910237 RepID=UPI003D139E95
MTANTKNRKQNNQCQHKALLARRINELGVEGVIYPAGNTERHPYTQEVIIMAMGQEIKQEELSRLCGVSQPQISQWANGLGLATREQLASLLPKLRNTAPGGEFHQLKVVTRTAIELPEGWEEACFLAAFENKVEEMTASDELKQKFKSLADQENKRLINDKSIRWDGYNARRSDLRIEGELNLDLLKQLAYGKLEQQHAIQCDVLEKSHQEQQDALNNQLSNLEKQQQAAEEEQENNQCRQAEHKALIEKYYADRPELNEVADNVKLTLALREHPEPEMTEHAGQALAELLDRHATEYAAELEITAIREAIDKKITESSARYESGLAELTLRQKTELAEKTIFGKYNSSAFSSAIEISHSRELMGKAIAEKAAALYSQSRLELALPACLTLSCEDHYSRRFEHIVRHNEPFQLSLADAFGAYCLSLPVIYEHESIQVSGEVIFTSGCENIVCYRLYSDRLLVKHRFLDRNGCAQNYIYVRDDADSALATVRELVQLHEISGDVANDLKTTLVRQGYLLGDIRTIY